MRPTRRDPPSRCRWRRSSTMDITDVQEPISATKADVWVDGKKDSPQEDLKENHSHDHDDHERLCAPGTPRSSQVNPPSSHNSNVPQVEKRIPHAHHDERNLASHLVAYSDGQRPSSLDNYLAIHAEDSGKSITSIEAEEVLPDDSPLTYIGMAHLHRQHSSN